MKETCLNCKRYSVNGGNCAGDYKFHAQPCLGYVKNDLGEMLHKLFKLEVSAGNAIKEGDKYHGVSKGEEITVTIIRIKSIDWNMRKLCLEVRAECKCWSEQYNRLKLDRNPKLTVIKGRK